MMPRQWTVQCAYNAHWANTVTHPIPAGSNGSRNDPGTSGPPKPPPPGKPMEVLQARFLRAGPGALQSRELLALLLRGSHGPHRASSVADSLLASFRSLPHVLAASREQLATVSGLGSDGICAIKLAEALGILLATEQLPDRLDPALSNYRQVLDYCRARLGFKAIEELHLLFLDNRNHLIRAERSQTGTVTLNFAFSPAYDLPETSAQRIIIVFENAAGYIPTDMAAANLGDANTICDRLNARLGFDRPSWHSFVADCMSICRPPTHLH